MSRGDGFLVGDIDTGLLEDSKVKALARRLRDPIKTAAAMCLYQALVLGSWRAGERITIEDSLPGWWIDDVDDLVAELKAVDLVDPDGSVPQQAWASWFLPAWNRRENRRIKAEKGGRAPRRNSGTTWGEPAADSESTPSEPDRPTDRTDRSVSSVRPIRPIRSDPVAADAANGKDPVGSLPGVQRV